jgi:hypothetical protein
MASRERKRAERQKRKDRSSERRSELAAKREQIAARTEARDEAARAELEPLADGDRPTVVTIGAVISALIAVSTIVGSLAGVQVTRFGSDGIEQGTGNAPLVSVIAAVALMGTMAYGMWRSRYWAVLGFQALLVIVLIAGSLGLVQATSWLQAVGTSLLVVGAGALFYFMIKAMARIQMPQRRGAEPHEPD